MQCRWRPLFLSFSRRSLSTHAPVVLRPYQELCLTSCTDALAEGTTRIGVSLPTGSGKTTVFVSLLSRIAAPPTNPEATRSLIVVNTVELARQTAEQVSRMFPHWRVEIEQGQKYHGTGDADVTIATYQTLNKEERLAKFDSRKTKAIIIDEAHHAAATSYRRLLSRFDTDIKHPDGIVIEAPPHKIPIIGFSATFSRHDGIALGKIFERIVYHRDFLEMIKEQWLCDIRFTSVKAELKLSEVQMNSVSQDFNTTSLAKVMNSDSMNEIIVRAWIDRASERKSTIVFACNVSHVIELTRTFRSFGIDARYVVSSTSAADRAEVVDAFKKGEFPVLVNCAILTEGADIPNIDCVVLARPTRSRNVFAQMVGRGMRLSPDTGKTDCRIIDFVDTHSRVGGVVSAPNLFGLDPSEIDVTDETPESLQKRIAERAAYRALPTPSDPSPLSSPLSVTYMDHDDPFEMAAETAGAEQAMKTDFAWVNCGGGIWVLDTQTRGFIRVEPDDNTPVSKDGQSLYKAHYSSPNYDTSLPHRYNAARMLMYGLPLAQTIRACDHFLVNKMYKTASPARERLNAPWRKQPATAAQLNLLAKKMSASPDVLGDLNIAGLTKGHAATIITRLRHGAIARYRKKVKAAIQVQKRAAKEESRVNREVVRVGQLPSS